MSTSTHTQANARAKTHRRVLMLLLAVMLAFQLGYQTVAGSGVFELELIRLQQIADDDPPNLAQHENVSQQQQQPQKPGSPHNASSQTGHPVRALSDAPLRVLVCLKEAFASQLDGPCTFGNSSITLPRGPAANQQPTIVDPSHQWDTSSARNSDSDSTTSAAAIGAKAQLRPPVAGLGSGPTPAALQSQTGAPAVTQNASQMTNLVRILFTFRWTKAFTIVLTTEELQPKQTYASRQATASNEARLSQNKSIRAFKHSTGPSTNRFIIVDRHVSTENEVLPNLELNPNKPWANRFSRSLKSSISYRFRVYCSHNYFGDGCTTFCRARNDQFGHYNCSSTGQKICHDGWQGPDCDRARCRPGCNQQHGYCEKPDTCQCRPGWNGTRCDECLTYPGCKNGYCLSPWQCICHMNWGGVLCDQDLNYCGTHDPCKNNGTCQNVAPGKYKCNCQDGFSGTDCEVITGIQPSANIGALMPQSGVGCNVNLCMNGGTCLEFDSLMIDPLSLNPMESSKENPGAGDHVYRCQCPRDWSGDLCQWPAVPDGIIVSDMVTPSNGEAQTGDSASLQLPSVVSSSKSRVSFIDIRHLISGVVIASVIGVFLASLLLAWCCLIAIERNRFSFIQMNVIKGSDAGSSRGRIKARTKLSIENVLRPPKPPPSYEESGNLNVFKHTSKNPHDKGSIYESHQSSGTLSKYLSMASQNRSR